MALIDDIIAYYKFEGTSGDVVDETGNHDGSIVGSVTRGETGKIANCFGFPGTASDYVSIPDDAAWAMSAFTFSAWVKFDSFAAWYKGAIIAQDTGGGNTKKFLFGYDDDVGKLKVQVNDPGVCASGELLSDAVTINTGTWYHVAITKIGTTLTFYLDGSEVGTPTLTCAIPDVARILTIGFGEGDDGLDGYVDEVGIWDAGKNAAEISELWNSGDGLTYPFSAAGTNMVVNVDDTNKEVAAIYVNVDDAWKEVASASVNKDDAWKLIF